MLFSCGLSILIFILSMKSGSSLTCYQCDNIAVTATNLTAPSGCIELVVNKTYCTITIVFYNDGNGYINIESETSHRAYGYNEDFVLLGLTIKNNGSYEYGLTYHCLTDGCNEPKLSKLQLLLNSSTIEHNIDTIVPLLYTPTPASPLNCSRYTNFTNPNTCYSQEQIGILCLTCLASIDGTTNTMCAVCSGNATLISILLRDERAYLLKTRKTSNHHFEVHCNIRECNGMEEIEQIRKLYRYDFDYNEFIGASKSALLFYNKNMIYFYVIILLIWNTL
jgi:hypothetical protein